jgi:Periplasmic protease
MDKYTKCSFSLFIFIGLLLFVSCEVDTSLDFPGPRPLPSGEQTVNGWIYNTMQINYLWNDEIPELEQIDETIDPEVFFMSLLSDKDGKGSPYSYIESTLTTKSNNLTTTHGINYTPVSFGGISVYYHINYVTPDSPAGDAGLIHGEWITHYNDIEINRNNYLDFDAYNGNMTLSLAQFIDGDLTHTRDVEIEAAIEMDVNPIHLDTVYTIEDKKVAYLVYNRFLSGPFDHNDHTYDNQLRSISSDFAAHNLDELILDLRYNPGGLVSCAQLLATLLAPKDKMGEVLCRLRSNKMLNEEYIYRLNESLIGNGTNLDMKRVYIITSSSTASSSEIIINGLRPHGVEVILVGGQTAGKNVASTEFTDDNFPWALNPIISTIENADGFGDYADGFIPDFNFGRDYEFLYRGEAKDLGDTEEYILSSVLQIINTGSLSGTRSRTMDNANLQILPHQQKGLHGAIVQ